MDMNQSALNAVLIYTQ